MQFTQYENYKDSNLEWLGIIPEDWEIKRVKDVASIFNGATPKSGTDEFWNGEVNWITPEDISQNLFIIESKRTITKLGYESCGTSLVPVNSVILTTRAPIGNLSINKVEVCTNQGCKSLVVKKNNYKFLYYLLLTKNSELQILGSGTTFLELSTSKLKAYLLSLPPIQTQKAIAEYLDEKTLQFDKKIELLQAKKEKYRELRKTIINEAVVKGIDKNVELRESGVNWIGKIPTHWNFERFGDKFKQNKRKNNNLENDNLLSLSYGKIKRKDINSGFGLLPESFESYQIVEDGDIILRLTDLQNDWNSLRVGLVRETGIITSAYVGLKLSKTLHSTFIYYLLHNYDIKKVFYSQGGSIRQSMKFADIKSLPLLYPDFETQVEIANYLDEKTNKIDEIVKTIDKNIEVLKEFRKTLINNVVTGKVKITQSENYAV